MLTKAKIRQVRMLEMKKYRDACGLFVAEGGKTVSEMMHAYECEWMIARPSWMAAQGHIPTGELLVANSEDEMRKVSLLKHPQDVLAVFRRQPWNREEADPSKNLVLALDGVQDPGNLGTIVRVADWFGVEHVVCSTDSADAYGPKAVQAAMGALARVKVYGADLEDFLKEQDVPLYGTFLDGDDLYGVALSAYGIIVMGNEGNGIRPGVEALIGRRLYIPGYPAGARRSESLNVAVATAIVCAEFRKRMVYSS
jgi:TrmH family RNA methyltransferase